MRSSDSLADDMIAHWLRGEDESWPFDADRGLESAFVVRALYHGVAGLLWEEVGERLPAAVAAPLREQALAQAMWEMAHRHLVGRVLTRLAAAGVEPLVLKGTALAYDLYEPALVRTRGDTDLLVRRNDVEATRRIMGDLGFWCDRKFAPPPPGMGLQEIWTDNAEDGPRHDIDLHWSVMNSPALEELLNYDECAEGRRLLPRLHPQAFAPNRVAALIHACLHRAANKHAPYFVGATTYFGGDRFIWAEDIHRLAEVLCDDEWQALVDAALRKGIGPVCLDGLRFAARVCGTSIPGRVVRRLDPGLSPLPRPSVYLLRSSQAERALKDVLAVNGTVAKLRFAIWRSFPSAEALRAKYPAMESRPLIVLMMRRIIDLLRPRPERIER